MPTESIWTALPLSLASRSARLSVHVSPRLTTGTTADGLLADFPAFASWPPSDLTLDVVIGGTPFPAKVTSAPDPDIWTTLFPATGTKVRSYEVVDHSQNVIHTYPLTKIVSFLQDHWTQVAMDSPDDFPAIVDLLAAGFEDIRFSGRIGMERWNGARTQLISQLNRTGVVDTTASSTTTFDFVQLEDFFASLDADDPAVKAALDAPVEPPDLDFHAAVQFVNQHPALLRLLGLVLDVEVDTGGTIIPNGPTTVAVKPAAAALNPTTIRTPLVHAEVQGARFHAVPRPGTTHLVPGWLRLEDTSQFEVIQVEADGGGLKAVDFAGNLGTKLDNDTVDTPDSAALPTLRADGFAVARPGKAKATKDQFTLGVTKEADLASDALDLYLDDLVRGFRIDVWDSISGDWHSTMARTGQYEIGASTVVPVTDEGFIGTTATKKPLSDDLYLPEEVFWWDGWSLVAPRPGKTLTPDQSAPDPLIDRPANDPGPDIDARFHFDVVPGSLPRLRYGADYRFRARLVDLAGNSLDAAESSDAHATPPTTFGRFEPPQTPPVLLHTPVGAGESLETIVLRSNYDAPASPKASNRHLVPGKVGQLAVEQHGLVDSPDPDPTTYQLLADLDAATLANHPSIDDPNAATLTYGVDSLPITWAPDPLVDQHAVRIVDGAHVGYAEHVKVIGGTGWPDYRATRLEVIEGTGAPIYDLDTSVLTVPLDKADISTLRLSAIVNVDQLESLGLWHWIVDALPAGPQGAQLEGLLKNLIRNGEHWMFEPFRDLTLVHAVRQPLRTPEFATPPIPNREPNATSVIFSSRLEFSRKSSSRVDGLASWRDPVDGGPDTTPPAFLADNGARIVDRQRALEVKVEHDPATTADFEQLRIRHELGDTKHRVITYRAVATTRFGEFFTTSAEVPFDGPGNTVVLDTGNPAEGVVPGSVKVTYTDGGVAIPLTEGTHFAVDTTVGSFTFHADNDPDHPIPTGAEFPPVGTTLTVVYLVPPITRGTAENPSGPDEYGPRIVLVPSSARPHAPRVKYVLPTFGWSDGPLLDNGQEIGLRSDRSGNGLRVYLERPWWTSGDGELLGVVTWPRAEEASPPDLEQANNPGEDADVRRPYVTQWGQDPVFRSRLLPRRYPRLSTFAAAVDTGTDLSLAELGDEGPTVHVAGHGVGFDEGRDLWYCDIDVDAGLAYSPFMRLALARWQPESIAHAELSPVVLADFVQLAPDRYASVAFDDADDSIMGVTLSGPTPSDTAVSGSSNPGRAFIIVEEKVQGIDGELAWTAVGDPIECNATHTAGLGQWTAEVHLPGERVPGRYRLVLEQFETLPEEPQKKPPLANPNIQVSSPADRLVHTDIIPV